MARACDNCGRAVVEAPSAPHKRFCSAECRDEWWTRRRRQVNEQIAKEQEAEALSTKRPLQ